MRNEISNSDDIIDSRDVIARIAELESEIEESGASVNLDTGDGMSADGKTDMTAEIEELAALQAFRDEAEGYAPDWTHGATLIRHSYFVEYAQQFAEDIGAINRDALWPNDCIDWEKAARELRVDYTAVAFGDVTYYVR